MEELEEFQKFIEGESNNQVQTTPATDYGPLWVNDSVMVSITMKEYNRLKELHDAIKKDFEGPNAIAFRVAGWRDHWITNYRVIAPEDMKEVIRNQIDSLQRDAESARAEKKMAEELYLRERNNIFPRWMRGFFGQK